MVPAEAWGQTLRSPALRQERNETPGMLREYEGRIWDVHHHRFVDLRCESGERGCNDDLLLLGLQEIVGRSFRVQAFTFSYTEDPAIPANGNGTLRRTMTP